MSTLSLQRRLQALGFDPGGLDGVWGPSTLAAVNAALDKLPGAQPAPAPPLGVVPAEWMPWAKMDRIIWHWTAGTNKASSVDRKHYHLLIEGDGKLVRGDQPISANAAPINGPYAAHCLNCNSGSIGVSLCGMAGAKERPFNAGAYPITQAQWAVLSDVMADLCRRYAIPVLVGTVLSHAEVETTLGINQKSKWDTARLPFDPALMTAKAIGDQMRAAVKARL